MVSLTPFSSLLTIMILPLQGKKMTIWKYIIKSNAGTIITRNHQYAEQKSKLGYLVFCKRENNIYRYPH